MRSITTNWNSSAYDSAGTFVDVISGNTVTIPANTPVNFRSLVDSVESGSYIYAPDALTATPATVASAPLDKDTVVINVSLSAANVENAPVVATTSDATKATVSPTIANTDKSGNYTFTITSVAAGEATITFTCGAVSDTTVVTVT